MKHVYAVGLGVVLGGFLGLPALNIVEQLTNDAFDRAYPVIEAQYEVLTKSPADWRIAMGSKKYRDCPLQEVAAYDRDSENNIQRLWFAREDGRPNLVMPPGNFRSSVYRIAPAPVGRLELYFLHRCGDRLVRTEVKPK